MKKALTILLCSAGVMLFGQQAKISVIDVGQYAYPVVKLKDKQVADKINNSLINLVLDTAYTMSAI